MVLMLVSPIDKDSSACLPKHKYILGQQWLWEILSHHVTFRNLEVLRARNDLFVRIRYDCFAKGLGHGSSINSNVVQCARHAFSVDASNRNFSPPSFQSRIVGIIT